MTALFETELSAAAGEWVGARVAELTEQGFSVDDRKDEFSPELNLLTRISGFPFREYPDYAAPWHLLQWPHMRWMHVYNIVYLIDSLRQPTGSAVGERITLEPFQVFIVLCFLGPEDPGTNLRMVREGLLTLARKNAKTTLVAGLSTALMTIHPDDHGLRGQEIQVGAADREQAGITHLMCERFISMDDRLDIKERFRSVPSKKTVRHVKTMTTLKCLSSDAYRAHGGNPAVVLLDEIGNVPANQAEEFYSVLTTGFGAQKEPLTLLLSTQAPNDQHFFSQQVDRVKRINEGILEDNSVAGFVFAVPEVDTVGAKLDPFDEDLWYLANPGIDTICSRRDLQDWSRKARDMPNLQNKFENLRLNRRVSETSSFVSRVAWEKNNVGFCEEDLYGLRCWAGLDLAETTDLAAFVLLFEDRGDGRMPVLPFFWIPGDGLQERCKRDKVPFDVWAAQGLIDTSSRQVTDYGTIADRIVELLDTYDVQGIGFDRWKMKYLLPQLAERGLEWTKEDNFMLEIQQNFMGQARSVELLEGLILESKLAHGNHPILKWNAANAVVVEDGNKNRKFQKNKSFGRIDGLVALAVAAHARDILEGDEVMGGSFLDDDSNLLLI